jgi:hypothetical protein
MRVLVTGARTYYSLAVVRRLHEAGHRVTAADWHPRSLGFYSHHTEGTWVHPPVGRSPRTFAKALVDFLQRRPHDFVLPLYEEGLVIARNAPGFAGLARTPLSDYGVMLRLHDKRSLYELAEHAGVPVPRWTVVRDAAAAAAVPFPIALKVPQSSSAVGVAQVRRPEDLPAVRQRLLRDNRLSPDAPLIAQEWIDGVQLCSLGFAWRGRPKGTLVYRNLCEFPRRGGAGIARESIQHDAVTAHAAGLLQAAGYHGIAGCDFLVERATGSVLLIDCNPRPTPGMLLAQRCGLDLVGMAMSEGEPVAAATLTPGLRTRTDPLVALWCLGRLLPQPHYWSGLRQALSFLRPKSCSRSDVLVRDDLSSLVGLLLAGGEAAVALLRSGLGGLTRPSQYHDYAFGR